MGGNGGKSRNAVAVTREEQISPFFGGTWARNRKLIPSPALEGGASFQVPCPARYLGEAECEPAFSFGEIYPCPRVTHPGVIGTPCPQDVSLDIRCARTLQVQMSVLGSRDYVYTGNIPRGSCKETSFFFSLFVECPITVHLPSIADRQAEVFSSCRYPE